jgi:hypothetical protein
MARPRVQLIPRSFLERPRHISLVIDCLLSARPGHDSIDPGAYRRVRPLGLADCTVRVAVRGTPGIRSDDRVLP